MIKRTLILVTLLSGSLALAQSAPTRVSGIDFPDGSSFAVGPANKARLRYHLGNNRLEVSLNGAAYTALTGGGGGSCTLVNCYGAGASQTDSTIGLDSTRLGIRIRDNATPISGSLFQVQSSGGTTTYLDVSQGGVNISGAASTGGVQAVVSSTAPTHTAITASAERSAYQFGAATWQWSTGALATERWYRVMQPTIGFVGASSVTTAVTLDVEGAPIAGANATIANAWALRVAAGATRLAGALSLGGTATLDAAANITGSSTSDLTVSHVGGTGSAPTCALGTNAGTGGTSCTLAAGSTDLSGKVSFTTGTASWSGTEILTLTFARSRANAGFCTVYGADNTNFVSQMSFSATSYLVTTTTTVVLHRSAVTSSQYTAHFFYNCGGV